MSDLVIHNVKALRPGVGVVGESIAVSNGRIVAIEDDASLPRSDASVDRVDGGGRLLTPGLIDIHVHGAERWLFESDVESMREGLNAQRKFGVTCILPTLYRVMNRASLAKLEALCAAIDDIKTVSVPGLHLEGPFLALPGAGSETVPGDLELLGDLLKASGGRVSAMSVSPDTPNVLPVVQRLRDNGVHGFMTHTAGSVQQARDLIDAGVHHATHFYDVFPIPEVSEPGVRPCGVVEAVLADERVSVDFIADGVHVDPVAIEMAVKCKGIEGVLAITDANVGAGLGDGQYDSPWGFKVRVREGDACRIHAPGEANDGMLAGSGLTMNKAVSNLIRWLDLPEHDAWAMASKSVADRLGLAGKGDLVRGGDADLVLWDRIGDELIANRTWVSGRCVYERESETAKPQSTEPVHG